MTLRKNKKGFVFTIITVFLVISVFFLSYHYLERNKGAQAEVAELGYAARANFIRENLVTDFFSMLDIEFDEIQRTDTDVILRFDRLSNISINNVYDTRLKYLADFYEENVSRMSNFIILLEEFTPSFKFAPYDSEFLIYNGKNPNRFYMYAGDYSNLNHIDAKLKLNITNESITAITYDINASTDDPKIMTQVYDVNNLLIINITQYLDSEIVNDPLRIQTNKSVNKYIDANTNITSKQFIEIHYGSVRHKNVQGPDKLIKGTYYIEAVGLDVEMYDFELNYSKLPAKAVLTMNGKMEIR